jgi:hypothetical protein
MDQLSYFQVGTEEAPVVSNSAMSALNPQEGGSIRKFINFFKEREEATYGTPSLKNGKLIHKYIEAPETFAVEDFIKPTDMMAGLLEKAAQLHYDATKGFVEKLKGINTQITSSLKKAETASAEILQTQAAFEKLSRLFNTTVEDAIRIFRCARIDTSAYKARTELGLVEDIVEAAKDSPITHYLKFLLNSKGKIVLSADDHKVIIGALNSLNTHKAVAELLGLRKDDFAVVDPVEIFREQPVFWKETITFEDGTKLPVQCKALLDRLIINHRTKTITYVDLKTTSYSIYTFQISFEDYRYYRQMAFYRRAIEFWFNSFYSGSYNLSEYTVDVLIVPVETKGLYLTGIYEVDQRWLIKGRAEAKTLLSRYAWHVRHEEYRFAPEEVGANGLYKYLKFTEPK